MKVLLYFENENLMKKSGIGRALEHQKKALTLNGVEFTTNYKDTFDIAHVNTYYPKSTHVVKKCLKRNIPVIVHGHSTEEDFCNSFKGWRFLKPFIYSFLKHCYSKPDLIITPTPYSKRLIEAYKYVKCPVVNLSNGIDLHRYSDYKLTEQDKDEIRKRFSLNDNDKVVIGIGWFFERKGFHNFIEVAKDFPNVKFIWFGNYKKSTNTKTVNKAIKHKTDNVILPGYVPQDFIIKMLHYANIFFFPSYEETEGIVLLEALATRTPVLVRDIGAFDYLTDNVDCFKAKNNEGFVEKINYILSNNVTKVTENGYKIAQERDLINIGKKLKEIYTNEIEKKGNKK